jgi:hypothetical protein
MEHNKASGSDGFLDEFFQSFWDIVKVDLLELFVVRDSWIGSVSNSVKSFFYQKLSMRNGFSNTDPYVY